jgi:hypothetical protein
MSDSNCENLRPKATMTDPMGAHTAPEDLQWFYCAACKREFQSTRADVESAVGHLCLAMDQGLTQRQGIERLMTND